VVIVALYASAAALGSLGSTVLGSSVFGSAGGAPPQPGIAHTEANYKAMAQNQTFRETWNG